MASRDPNRNAWRQLPLDEKLLSLTPEEIQFLKSQTGIGSDADLKLHILTIQKKAFSIYRYPCIRLFHFARTQISRMPAYSDLHNLLRTHQNPIFLDIGCCFGNDTRKVVADGWPVWNVIASDLHRPFWDFGYDLFRTTPERFPAAFVAGDVLDPSFLPVGGPAEVVPPTPRPELASLKSFAQLKGHVSAIYAGSFFHLFDEEKQLEVANRLASLLSPQPGSMIFGVHMGSPQKGKFKTMSVFCHSPESWRELWEVEVFKNMSIRLEVKLEDADHFQDPSRDAKDDYVLIWSVTRL